MLTKLIQSAAILSVIALAAPAAHAQGGRQDGGARADGTAVVIPTYAMNDLLRCRHENRPEEVCFARLSHDMDRGPAYAQNNH